jgi:hypothetical protein
MLPLDECTALPLEGGEVECNRFRVHLQPVMGNKPPILTGRKYLIYS